MPFDQKTDTHAGRVGLLAGFGEKDQVAIEGHTGAFHQQEHHQVGGQVVLVVSGAAAPDIAITQNRSEGIHRPLVALHTNDIGVRQEQQRPLRAVAFQPRDQIRPARLEGQDFGWNAFGRQDLLEVLDGCDLVSRRVAGIDLHERPEVTKDLSLQRTPIDRRPLDRCGPHEGDEQVQPCARAQ